MFPTGLTPAHAICAAAVPLCFCNLQFAAPVRVCCSPNVCNRVFQLGDEAGLGSGSVSIACAFPRAFSACAAFFALVMLRWTEA